MEFIEVFVPHTQVDSFVDSYMRQNEIEFKNQDVYINNEAMGKAGFAAAMRFCYLMLISGDNQKRDFAVNVLENVKMHKDGFAAVTFCCILKNYRECVSDLAEKRMIDFLKDMRDIHLSDYFEFQGVNDNFPLMGIYYCMIFGELMNDEELLHTASRRFDSLEALIKRRGTLSEYCSGSYTPLQLSVLSSLAEDAVCERYRNIAIAAELRVWADYVAHFNPRVGLFSGPFSRTYTHTVNGFNNSSMFFFHMLFHPDAEIDYGNITMQQKPYMVFASLYYLCFCYHIFPQTKDLIFEREYPFRYEAVSEFSSSMDEWAPNDIIRNISEEDNFYEYPGGETQQHLYMTENYSIGTATREFHNGIQTDSFFLSYKKRDNPAVQSDVRNIFCRYIINDIGVGNGTEGFIGDYGRKTAFQKDNYAMVLYKPKLMRIWDEEKHLTMADISSLRLCIFIPKQDAKPDKIYLGDKLIDGGGQAEKEESIYIKDGKVFIAFHPLHTDNAGRECAIEVTEDDDYIIISFYNYCGDGKKFAERELLHLRSGFICQVSSSDEIASFEEFMAESEKYELTDEYIQTVHTRQTFIRRTAFRNDKLMLSCEYNPASEGIKNIACNDRIISAKKMGMTGFNEGVLPYMY